MWKREVKEKINKYKIIFTFIIYILLILLFPFSPTNHFSLSLSVFKREWICNRLALLSNLVMRETEREGRAHHKEEVVTRQRPASLGSYLQADSLSLTSHRLFNKFKMSFL